MAGQIISIILMVLASLLILIVIAFFIMLIVVLARIRSMITDANRIIRLLSGARLLRTLVIFLNALRKR